MRDFYQLTNRGRALRLRKMALAALERYDLDVNRVQLLSNDMNGIFRLEMAGGEKAVLRISVPGDVGHSLEAINSEMVWLAALRRETDLNVPRPFTTRDGALVTTVQVPGVPEARHCVVFSWVKGVDLADRPSPENWYKLGEFASRLHDHGLAFKPPKDFDINQYDKVFPFQEPVVIFDDAHRHIITPGRREVFQETVDRVQAALDRLKAGPDEMGVIHGDLHQWNTRVYRGQISALDFEDLMWGYAVQDIAVTFFYIREHSEYLTLRAAFKEGYTSCRVWPERRPGVIDTFIAGRVLVLANYILEDPSPDYRTASPEYIEIWERHLRSYLDNAC
jgi:Ser/Thr protein kinase RdoA (MazF antagonist)